jgi:hypothetical protein
MTAATLAGEPRSVAEALARLVSAAEIDQAGAVRRIVRWLIRTGYAGDVAAAVLDERADHLVTTAAAGRATAAVHCPACALTGDPHPAPVAAQLAAVHDDVHHHGTRTAAALPARGEAPEVRVRTSS